LEEQDKEIKKDYSKQEINNPLGREQRPDKKIQRDLEKMADDFAKEQ